MFLALALLATACSSSAEAGGDEVGASFLRGLEDIIVLLGDGFDHPEVWGVLKEVAEQDDVPTLLRLLRAVTVNFETAGGRG